MPTLWWLTAGLVLLDSWCETGRRWCLAACLPLLALAAMARPEMPALMAALLPLTALARGWSWSALLRPLSWHACLAAGVLVGVGLLGPAFVFAAQQFDDRLMFSGPVLGCILLFSVSTVVASGLRASDELRRS